MTRDKMYTFNVTGSGPLPHDMLRYDRCWPRTGEDAAILDRAVREHRSVTSISVMMEGLSEPTVARWKSFGWKVEVTA